MSGEPGGHVCMHVSFTPPQAKCQVASVSAGTRQFVLPVAKTEGRKDVGDDPLVFLFSSLSYFFLFLPHFSFLLGVYSVRARLD